MTTPSGLRTRIAPTPSGLLHPGNGLSFILTWGLARAAGGRVLLRIDDLDKTRTREVYVADIFETLEWLGLDYDEGPAGVEDFFRSWSQHTRMEEYHSYLSKLKEQGALFACTCSRRQVREMASDGQYPGTCSGKGLPFEGGQTAWRVAAPAPGQSITLALWPEGPSEQHLETIDAFVVRQKNGAPAYQLASLVDDLRFHINFVVRGEDLWGSTLSQHYLAGLLGLRAFQEAWFWHHPLITDGQGHKLSKSKGAGSLRAWREAGSGPAALYRQAARVLGLEAGADTPSSFLEAIRAAKIIGPEWKK